MVLPKTPRGATSGALKHRSTVLSAPPLFGRSFRSLVSTSLAAPSDLGRFDDFKRIFGKPSYSSRIIPSSRITQQSSGTFIASIT